tara:strand:- start:1350 stop:2315 length:966 start_codon:yes stop_codon:yes gene_type:complete
MKKFLSIFIFYFLFLNNALSEIIILECPNRKGEPVVMSIDTLLKKVDKYDYRVNPEGKIEFEFTIPSIKNKEGIDTFLVFFNKIDLENKTKILKVVDNVTKKNLRYQIDQQKLGLIWFDDITDNIVQRDLTPVQCYNQDDGDKKNNLNNEDNINNYSLEFYKIGDSLLDVADESLILETKKISEFKNNKYYDVTFEVDSDFFKYVQFYLKSGDKNYTIMALAFIKEMNFEECLRYKDKLKNEWDVKFSKQYFIEGIKPIEWDRSGKSITNTIQYTFYDNAVARISCRDWSEKLKKEYNYNDDLRISYESAEITNWMKNGYK